MSHCLVTIFPKKKKFTKINEKILNRESCLHTVLTDARYYLLRKTQIIIQQLPNLKITGGKSDYKNKKNSKSRKNYSKSCEIWNCFGYFDFSIKPYEQMSNFVCSSDLYGLAKIFIGLISEKMNWEITI